MRASSTSGCEPPGCRAGRHVRRVRPGARTASFPRRAAGAARLVPPVQALSALSDPNETSSVVRQLIDAVEREPDRRWRDADFDALHVHASTVRRQFRKRFGMIFVKYARARRLGAAFKAIRAGERVIMAQLDAGYKSGSGFRDAFAEIMGAPPASGAARALRRLARYAARSHDGGRRRGGSLPPRVCRSPRAGTPDRPPARAGQSRDRARPHRANRADRGRARRRFRRTLDAVHNTACSPRFTVSERGVGTRCSHPAGADAQPRARSANLRPCARPPRPTAPTSSRS